MKIELSGKRGIGVFFIIDDEDYDLIRNHSWWPSKQVRGVRVETDLHKEEQKEWGITRISLARYLLKCRRKDMRVDHINGNPLDNRRCNLRVCSHANNIIRNRVSLNKNNGSGYRGVSWDRFREKWIAQLMYKRKHIFLGRFQSKEEAKQAVQKGLKKYYGKYTQTT